MIYFVYVIILILVDEEEDDVTPRKRVEDKGDKTILLIL
jgi:hypothetical protein